MPRSMQQDSGATADPSGLDTGEPSTASSPEIDQGSGAQSHLNAHSVPAAARNNVGPVAPSLVAVFKAHSRLHRIVSDWEPESDILALGNLHPRDVRKEFEELEGIANEPTSAMKQAESPHNHYFRSQVDQHQKDLRIRGDSNAHPHCNVLVDEDTKSIFDAYLLRCDISKNVNEFRRHQIVVDQQSGLYSFITRCGRTGLTGQHATIVESWDLKKVTASFFRLFRKMTGVAWYQRHVLNSREGGFVFVELDHRRNPVPIKNVPDYRALNANVSAEVKGLMELVLHGPSAPSPSRYRKRLSRTARQFPSAPHYHLSRWAIFLAFKTLEAIRKHVESGQAINWRNIVRASSHYRSQVPYCAEHERPPVISSYHAIVIEMEFLHALWPRQETADLLVELRFRQTSQAFTWKSLTQPLYQAYSSLKHGFRRLTDSSTLEFQAISLYLWKGCHESHNLTLEIQDIYRLFIKSGVHNPYNHWLEVEKKSLGIWDEERLLLWHGTPLSSLLGILEVGLQVRRPGANYTGSMFGDGIYLADMSSKSANYCRHHEWDREAALFLCEADVGAQRIRSLSSIYNGHDIAAQSNGRTRCIQGLGRTAPQAWTKVEWEMGGLPRNERFKVLMPDISLPYAENSSSGSLRFNEYVIYDPSHLILRYLVRVKVRNKNYRIL